MHPAESNQMQMEDTKDVQTCGGCLIADLQSAVGHSLGELHYGLRSSTST